MYKNMLHFTQNYCFIILSVFGKLQKICSYVNSAGLLGNFEINANMEHITKFFQVRFSSATQDIYVERCYLNQSLLPLLTLMLTCRYLASLLNSK